MNTAQEIQIILNSYCMDNRSKIEAIVALIQSDMEETYFLRNHTKIRQQILSEILYLLEKIEKNKVTTAGYIAKRIKNCTKNCAQSGWIVPRKSREFNNIEYLENLSLQAEASATEAKQEQPKKATRKKGWHKKTEQRLERLLLSSKSTRSTRKSTRKKTEYVPLFA